MYVRQGCERWVHNACFDTTKIRVDSFERCFASRIVHNYA